MLLWVLLLLATLQSVSPWDLKAPAEKYWNMKRLGLKEHHVKEGQEVPFEVPSYYKYYHYNHQQQQPQQQQQQQKTPVNIHQSNRISYFEKSDRSIPSPHRNPAGCVYKGRKYAHGEEVVTTQPCLNCTCQRGFVSCFLRVCPVLDPPENDDTCYLLKEPGTCCAVLKCSGLLPAASTTTTTTTTSTSTTTKAPSTFAYHFNPIKTSSSFFNGNSLERKAPEAFRRATSRPPQKDYWTSIRPTNRQQPQSRPFLRGTSRPSSYASITRVTTTQRPVNRNGFPVSPTFSQRRPNYPVSVTSKPTLRRTVYTTTVSPSRKTSAVTLASSASSHQLGPPLLSPHLKDNDEDGGNAGSFFRMSSILV